MVYGILSMMYGISHMMYGICFMGIYILFHTINQMLKFGCITNKIVFCSAYKFSIW
jgi:hypothetical protein